MRRTVGSGSVGSVSDKELGQSRILAGTNVLPRFRVASGDVSTRVKGPAGWVAAKETIGADV